MRIIKFDNNITSDCPISGTGNATTTNCLYCRYFKGFHGFTADCVADDPDDCLEEALKTAKEETNVAKGVKTPTRS